MNTYPRTAGALSRLLYTSRPRLEGTREEIAAQVCQIAAVSGERNDRVGLTGVLLFSEDSFIQILEGPSESLERVFENICCDVRHCAVDLVAFAAVSSRMFDKWAMALLCHDPGASPAISEALRDIELIASINAREAARQTRELLDRHAQTP